LVLPVAGCVNSGVAGSSSVSQLSITGTVFTIVLENKDEGQALDSKHAPYLTQLAKDHGHAVAYTVSVHPSLPNYITMTSGATQGITDDNDPSAHPLTNVPNLGDQLDAAHVPWRAYMESMGAPCGVNTNGAYVPKHNPFVYYTSMTGDEARCRDHVVDFDTHFAQDLASNQYRYMWVTPNMCSDMHDCSVETGDAWLKRVVPQILASPGYQNGGVLFILFDEGGVTFKTVVNLGKSDVAAVVASPRLVGPGYESNVAYDHQSYLATVEDIFGLPRLTTTMDATPMADFFAP
jgi:hypothetical protein